MTVQPHCPPSTPVLQPLMPDPSRAEELTGLELPMELLSLSSTVRCMPSTNSGPSTETELSSDDSIFSSAYNSGESNCSPLSGSQTPVKALDPKTKALALSESVTPVDEPGTDYWQSLDPDQLTLRLHLHAALQGEQTVPEWKGLAEALRVYFNNSWYQDAYTLKYCEQKKEFLFWNAVADEKWRTSDRGY